MDANGQPDLANPMIPDWPEAEFIVGNPPFIGKGAEMRRALGGDYVEALWRANPRVPKSADFVMQWWDRAAHTLAAKDSPLVRFGLVTTNSITQEFNRRVIQHHLEASEHVSIVMAVPDHPWTKATRDAAAVRIAMTVAEAGQHPGQVMEVVSEQAIDTDAPQISVALKIGVIHADLSTGANITVTQGLRANNGLSCNGMMLAGQGFWVDRSQANHLATQDGWALGSSPILRRHIGGSELTQRPRDGFVIDFFGLDESEARQKFPAAYQWLIKTVKPEREVNADKGFREKWWLFGRVRPEIRAANKDLDRFIATTRTSKHRIFQFVNGDVVPNHEIVVISSKDAALLGALLSQIHTEWALRAGGWLGVGNDPRYNKGRTFDPFPFPDPTPDQRAAIADLAEELDATRKLAIAETDKLTMTELYNLRAKLRSGVPLDDKDQRRAIKARAAIVDRLHEQLDQAVADAYGWGEEWAAGTLGPSEIVARLVALNHERAKEEAAGTVRWLRPDYQRPRYEKK